MKRFRKWIRSIPHLFGKVMVVWCVACATVCSVYSLWIMLHTDDDPSSLLGVILAFFGGELALMFGRNAFQKKGKDDLDD